MSYGGSAAFNAGVGKRARADARIILEGIKNTTTQVRTRESNYVVWQKQLNQGSREETLTLPSFTGPRTPTFKAPGGITIQIPAGEFRSQIATPTARAEANQISGPPVMGATENYDDLQKIF